MKHANVGRDIYGRPVRLPISTLSTIAAGLPGSGKSSLLRVIAAEASFEADVALVTIDPKRTELGLWKPRASVHATDAGDVLDVLGRLVALIEHRTRWMEANEVEAWPVSPQASLGARDRRRARRTDPRRRQGRRTEVDPSASRAVSRPRL